MLVLDSRYNSHLSLPQLVRVDENPFVPKLQWLQAPFSLLGHRKTLLYIIPLGITKIFTATAAAKSLQSCPTLCNPIDGSPPESRPWDSPDKNTGVGCHFLLQHMKAKSESAVAQSCPTLSDLMDCSPPGSSVRGIFQARVLEWGAIAFSEGLYRDPQNSPISPCYC